VPSSNGEYWVHGGWGHPCWIVDSVTCWDMK